MMGIAFFAIFIPYCLLLWWATRKGWRLGGGKANRRSYKPWLFGSVGFLMVYLPVFWDHIPTVIAHQYYCHKEVGFWAYKSGDEWQAENLDTWTKLNKLENLESDIYKHTSYGIYQEFNNRFAIQTYKTNPIPILITTISRSQLFDLKTDELIAENVTVGSGVGAIANGGYRFWLNQESCQPEKLVYGYLRKEILN